MARAASWMSRATRSGWLDHVDMGGGDLAEVGVGSLVFEPLQLRGIELQGMRCCERIVCYVGYCGSETAIAAWAITAATAAGCDT